MRNVASDERFEDSEEFDVEGGGKVFFDFVHEIEGIVTSNIMADCLLINLC